MPRACRQALLARTALRSRSAKLRRDPRPVAPTASFGGKGEHAVMRVFWDIFSSARVATRARGKPGKDLARTGRGVFGSERVAPRPRLPPQSAGPGPSGSPPPPAEPRMTSPGACAAAARAARGRPASVFARDESKAWFERFSLLWAPLSVALLLGGVLASGAWRRCGRDEYLAISVAGCAPGLAWPLLFPGAADARRPYARRFWVKAAVWVAVFSFYGNYFWTHYFYSLLGARYLFDSYQLNGVPVVTYLCTYFYFSFYFSFSNVVLRLLARSIRRLTSSSSRLVRLAGSATWAAGVFTLSVLTALFEAVSIQHFPLYTYTDTYAFMTIGSVFYGIYFMVGFPMFFALDEAVPTDPDGVHEKVGASDASSPAEAREPCSLWYVTQNALAAVALVTLLLDLWRLFIGDIYGFKGGNVQVPFIYQPTTAPTLLESARQWTTGLHSFAGW